MIHPIERYNELKGWIPETDIDGIDAKKEYASYCKNVDFENGFLQGCIAPSLRVIPAEIKAWVDGGYEILESVLFTHSTRGDIFFYILWYGTMPTVAMRFYVEEISTGVVTELDWLETWNDTAITGSALQEKPYNINFSLSEDQLKINLNCKVKLDLDASGDEEHIFNLTLVYLPEITLASVVRSAGWYLTPRWLGWQFDNVKGFPISFYSGQDSVTTDFDPVPGWMTLGSGAGVFTPSARQGQVLDLASDGVAYVSDLRHVEKIAIWAVAPTANTSLRLRIYDAIIGEDVWVADLDLIKSGSDYERSDAVISIRNNNGGRNVGVTSENKPIARQVESYLYPNVFGELTLYLEAIGDTSVHVNTLKISSSPESSMIVVAKYRDGQRGKLGDLADGVTSTRISALFFSALGLWIEKAKFDFRIETFEIYFKSTSGLYYLVSEVDVDDGLWVEGTAPYTKYLIHPNITFIESVTTLNFNYGLGSTVRVDTESIIYDEVQFKARNYFVKNDIKVYQSHISGTGRAQPDSFPYDASVEFGYFITNRDDSNLALAVTNLEELLIVGKKRNYTYYIEGNVGTVFRTLKKNEGGKSILSKKTFVKSLSGNPSGEVLLWTDNYGAYIYGGGREVPKNIMVVNLRNYWKALGNYKNIAVAFYNEARNEFWIAVRDEIIVYELSFGTFKRYEFGFRIKSYLGENNGIYYFLTYDNEIRILDTTSNIRMDWEVETHYNSNTIVVEKYPIEAPEHESKILQEIYIAVKDTVSSAVKYIITADGNVYDEIIFTTGMFTDVLPSPLLIRYGKVKIKLKVSKVANIRELGYSFSVPNQALHQQVKKHIQGIGMSSGKDAGIGL